MAETTNNAVMLLTKLHQDLQKIDPAIVGSIELKENEIVIRGGKLRLTVDFPKAEGNVHPSIVHAHVNAHFSHIGTKPLTGCFVAFSSPPHPIDQIAMKWLRIAAPPILSLLNGRDVLHARHFSGHEPFAVSRRHGYVSPLAMQTFSVDGKKDQLSECFDLKEQRFLDALQNEPLFLNATELAGDDELHFVKITLENLNGAWVRSLEMDDHAVNIHGEPWPPKYSDSLQAVFSESPSRVMVTGYALFFKDKNAKLHQTESEIIDEAIEQTVALFSQKEKPELTSETLLQAGIDPAYIHDLISFIQLVFGRYILSQIAVRLSESYTLIKKDGSYERNIPLKTVPLFQRAMLMIPGFVNSPKYNEGFQVLALSGSEFCTVNQALHRKSKPEDLLMAQPVIFEPDIKEDVLEKTYSEVMAISMAELKSQVKIQKPWWKFW